MIVARNKNKDALRESRPGQGLLRVLKVMCGAPLGGGVCAEIYGIF